MKYYCMSDIHGCLSAFEEALELVLPHLDEPDTVLMLMGDYIHGGEDSYGVLDRIIALQREYGRERVIALMGNHEEMAINGFTAIDDYSDEESARNDDMYISWMSALPLYHEDGKTIFVHAGVDEEAGDEWEYGTSDYFFTEKYPADTGHFFEDIKIVAGHIHTSEISCDPRFNGIFFDGHSHYYIDADTLSSGFINILKVDTEKQEYLEVIEHGEYPVLPYEEFD